MEFKLGCKVPKKELIEEGYKVEEPFITANVCSNKVEELINSFIDSIEEPGFFILEVPLNEIEEKLLRKSDIDPYHCGVYYIDFLSKNEMKNILNKYKNILLEDGMINFGFASQETNDELVFRKYNVTLIYTNNINKYTNLLESLHIKQNENLITAWDTFEVSSPGESYRITYEGKDIYDVVKELKEIGLYRYEVRDE